MDTISLKGIRPNCGEITVGFYTHFRVDAALNLDLRAAVSGDDSQSVDIPQVAKRLSKVLQSCEGDETLESNPSLVLQLVAGRLLNAAMLSWQINSAEITVRSKLNCDAASTLDEVSVTLRRVADEVGSAFEDLPKLQYSENLSNFSADSDNAGTASNADTAVSLGSEDSKNPNLNNPTRLRTTAVISMRGEAKDDTCLAMLYTIMNFEQNPFSDSSIVSSELVNSEFADFQSNYKSCCKSDYKTNCSQVSKQGSEQNSEQNLKQNSKSFISQVEGVSPLYYVSNQDGDEYSSIVIISTSSDENLLLNKLYKIESEPDFPLHLSVVGTRNYGASSDSTHTVDTESLTVTSQESRVALLHPTAVELEPWMHIESDASLDGSPLAYLLAFTKDAGRVGLYSERWIMGDCK